MPVVRAKTEWRAPSWLAAANTALAFWLWNRAQAVLSALEASLINNTMLIQIAVLAVLFLDERLTVPQIAGLVLAGGGVLFVQLARMRPRKLDSQTEHGYLESVSRGRN